MFLSSQKPRRMVPPNRSRARLVHGAALLGAAAIAGSASAGPPANALPSIPFGFQQTIKAYAGPGTQGFQNNAGGATGSAPTYFTATLGGVTTGTVTLNATRTILDWTSFQVGANATLDFLFPGATAAAIAGDIVINRLQGSATIDIAGAVNGLTAYGTQTGGQLWFLAANGVIFEPRSAVAAGRIVAANAFTTTAANDAAFLSATGDDASLMRDGGSLIDLRGAVSASGASLDSTGAILITGAVNTGPAGTADLESTGAISADVGAITAGTLTGSSVGGASFTSQANAIGAVSNFSNGGTGNIVLVDSTPGAGLRLGEVVNYASGPGSGSISLTQAAGDVVQSTLVAGGYTVLQANGDISIAVPAGRLSAGFILAGGNIAIDAERFTSQTLGALEAGGSLSITLADPNGLVLSDNAPVNGSSSWMLAPSLQSASVTVLQSDASGIDIGAATIVGSDQQSANLTEFRSPLAAAAARAALATAPDPSLTLLTPGPVTITGHILPAAGVTPDLTIGASSGDGPTPSVIEIINDNVAPPSGSANPPAGGSIGGGVMNPNGSYSGLQAFGAVTLTARTDILAGTSTFVAASLGPSPPNGAPANKSGGVLIAANTLTVAAGGAILQQNTSGVPGGGASGPFSGLWIGSGAVGALTVAPYDQAGPASLALYGVLAGAAISGPAAAASGLIDVSAPPPPGAVYQFNGCLVGEPDACGGGASVLAHLVDGLAPPPPSLLASGGDGDPPVVGPVAVDLWRTRAAVSGGFSKLSDAELFGVLTEEVNKTLDDYDLKPGLCYDVHLLSDDIYKELLKSDIKGVSGATLDLALRKNNATLRDVIDEGVFEAAQQTAVYCQSQAQDAAGAVSTANPVLEPARFGEVMARAREAMNRVPPKILVAVGRR